MMRMMMPLAVPRRAMYVLALALCCSIAAAAAAAGADAAQPAVLSHSSVPPAIPLGDTSNLTVELDAKVTNLSAVQEVNLTAEDQNDTSKERDVSPSPMLPTPNAPTTSANKSGVSPTNDAPPLTGVADDAARTAVNQSESTSSHKTPVPNSTVPGAPAPTSIPANSSIPSHVTDGSNVHSAAWLRGLPLLLVITAISSVLC